MKVRPERVLPLPVAPYDPTNTGITGTHAQPSALADLNADVRSYLESKNASLTTYNIQLDYNYWKAGSFDVPLRECFS
jgi:hypothetical protein